MEAASTNTVLLVEGDTALRRVIAMGLRHQGMSVLEAASPQQARALLGLHPSLLVVDVDSGLASDRMLLPDLRAYDGLAETPAVVLTWDCSPDLQAQVGSDGAAVCLAKPFDARRLFAEAELLLEAALQRRQVASAVAASAEALYEPAYGRTAEIDEIARASSPSIWPVVLALGLMIAISGLLIHPAIVALGVAVVVGSMLLWGFEPGVKPGRA
ncbi:MAG TPA: response regulator [Ktedonobacterales bacterium]|jgi:DNA-binding response OmpR family regulator